MPTDRSLRRLLLQWGLLWSVIILGSLLWNEHLIRQRIYDFSRHEAETTINKDLTFRRWVTMHGGVYVRPTEQTPPNPWLKIPKRDVITTEGDPLTLMNPAYVTRQAMSMYNESFGAKGHITSLHLKNPGNAPDDWEREALQSFDKGVVSASVVAKLDGALHYRLILPMKMEKGCLKCHADTGIPVGGIRGGISASIPMAPHLTAAGKSIKGARLAYGGIWLIGMVSIFAGSVLYDRQQRRREEAEERLLETALFLRESQTIARVGGWKSNPDTGFLRWTDEMYQIMEYEKGQELSHDAGFVFVAPADQIQLKEALLSAWQNGSGFSLACRMNTAKGHQFWAEIRCVGRVENHSGSYLVGTLQDITTYKQAEELMRFAKESAEASTRTKNELLAVISHELRTPLNGVIGGAQLLGMTELTPDQQEYLQMVEISANNELALVNDLLDLASLDASEIKIQETPFVLRDSIMAAVVPHRTVVEDRGLALKVQLAEQVVTQAIGDGRRLTQIVSNLIGNAVKFTHQGEISLSADTVAVGESGLLLRLKISDTGIGIEEKDQERIFEPFVQADMSHTRNYGGTGLGLSICNKLVTRMGGIIRLESRPGDGSAFYIELPFKVAEQICEPVAADVTTVIPAAADEGSRLTVLIAEDNQINLKATSSIVGKLGYNVLCATDGKEALTHWLTGGVDIVLMDIQMPVMDGIEALQFIRHKERSSTRKTPVVALTAHAMQDDRERLLKAGFDGYLAKPVDMQMLAAELARFANQQKTTEG